MFTGFPLLSNFVRLVGTIFAFSLFFDSELLFISVLFCSLSFIILILFILFSEELVDSSI
mgnify:CR=1 FL=1